MRRAGDGRLGAATPTFSKASRLGRRHARDGAARRPPRPLRNLGCFPDRGRSAGGSQALVAQCESEVSKIERALSTTERDYDAGDLTARQYNKRETPLTDELDVARSAVDQPRTHRDRLAQNGPAGDAEGLLLKRLAALKKVVAAGVGNAPDLPAVRNVLGDLFESVQLVADGESCYLWPIPRDLIGVPGAPPVGRLPDGEWDGEVLHTKKVELALTIEPASKVTG